jgi:hypothetical protein
LKSKLSRQIVKKRLVHLAVNTAGVRHSLVSLL